MTQAHTTDACYISYLLVQGLLIIYSHFSPEKQRFTLAKAQE